MNAVISSTDGFAYVYRLHGYVGNAIGLFELFFALWWLGWSFGITWMGYRVASAVVEKIGQREWAVWHEGSWGHPVDVIEAIKMFTLLIVFSIAVWISGYSLASNADELLDFFNNYDQYTDDEASTKTNNTRDPEGTAIVYDLGYHVLTIFGADLVFEAVYIGAWWFADKFKGFHEVHACDVNDYDSSQYSGIIDDFKGLS